MMSGAGVGKVGAVAGSGCVGSGCVGSAWMVSGCTGSGAEAFAWRIRSTHESRLGAGAASAGLAGLLGPPSGDALGATGLGSGAEGCVGGGVTYGLAELGGASSGVAKYGESLAT